MATFALVYAKLILVGQWETARYIHQSLGKDSSIPTWATTSLLCGWWEMQWIRHQAVHRIHVGGDHDHGTENAVAEIPFPDEQFPSDHIGREIDGGNGSRLRLVI